MEPAGRVGSGSQDRLAALEAVANLGAPVEVFDSEGECLRGVDGSAPGAALEDWLPRGAANEPPSTGQASGQHLVVGVV